MLAITNARRVVMFFVKGLHMCKVMMLTTSMKFNKPEIVCSCGAMRTYKEKGVENKQQCAIIKRE